MACTTGVLITECDQAITMERGMLSGGAIGSASESELGMAGEIIWGDTHSTLVGVGIPGGPIMVTTAAMGIGDTTVMDIGPVLRKDTKEAIIPAATGGNRLFPGVHGFYPL